MIIVVIIHKQFSIQSQTYQWIFKSSSLGTMIIPE